MTTTVNKLTKTEFLIVCGEFEIDPGIVLESDRVCDTLAQGCTMDQLREVIKEEF